ncbi:hypothetical protein FLL45_03500 [Aliikangiella marina]|uniref:EpsG family protein n=1 Tax=Aliikangiella marina TaxID=1712262 RepID=A0A545TIH6_9GAMM|nr:EpsG family protein [Aliikangiella marina]TQV77030.1 hypothetical protein FLL45_03500 [Aliikangiella marina]
MNLALDSKLITLLVLGSIALFFFPLLFLFASILVLTASEINKSLAFSIIGGGLALFFTLINLLKVPESDMLVYIDAIREIRGYSFFDVIQFNFVSMRSIEFIFNYYIYFVSFIDTGGFFFSFLSVFIIYILFALSLDKVMPLELREKYLIFFSLILFSITFSLSGHLVRQYLAASVLIYGIASFKDSPVKGGLFILMSPFVHISVAPFVVLIPLLYKSLSRKAWVLISVFSVLIALAMTSFVVVLRPYMEIGFVKDDGSIPVFLIVFDAILFFGFVCVRVLKTECFEKTKVVYCFALLLVCCLIVSHEINLIFLRYYFLMDFVRAVFLMYLIYFFSTKIDFSRIVSFLVFTVCCLLFVYRLDSSPWDYGATALEILFLTDVKAYAERIGMVWGV